MIHLYNKSETVDNAMLTNGLCVLDPTVCNVSEVAGGMYELYMEHPTSKPKADLIVEDMLIRAPVPPTTIPEITLPETKQYKISKNGGADFWQKLPVYKHTPETADALAEIRANPSLYAYAASRGFNEGAYCVYNGGIYRAKKFVISVLPGTDSSAWAWVAPLYPTTQTSQEEEEEDEPTSQSTYTPGTKYSPGLAKNTLVIRIASYDKTYFQVKDPLGRIGYVDKDDLTVVTTVEETIPAQYIVEQIFRVYKVESDEDSHLLKVYARHISYDFQGNSLMACNFTDTRPADAIAMMQGSLMIADNRRIACERKKRITADWSFKNPINALLDQDNGLVKMLNLRLVRNNEDFFLLKNGNPPKGIRIEHGVNMTGVTWSRSNETQITRVVPRCKNGDNEYLYLEHGGTWSSASQMDDDHWVPNADMYVDSPLASQFPVPKIEVLDCDFCVGEEYEHINDDGTSEKVKRDEANCREEMLAKAQARFTDDKVDQTENVLTVEFVLLGDTEEYKQYRGLQRVSLYDVVTVKTEMIESSAQVTQYEYNCLLDRYNSITVGKVNAFSKRLPGYTVVNESITYDKLSPDLINRIRTSSDSRSSDTGAGGLGPGGTVDFVNTPNTKTTDGYVTKGQNHASKVWKTDAQGNPDWRDEASAPSVVDNNPTLAWNSQSKVGSVGGTDLHVTMPANPAPEVYDGLDSTSTTKALSAKQGKVLNDSTVKLTGNQTISGNKYFSDALVKTGTGNAVIGFRGADLSSINAQIYVYQVQKTGQKYGNPRYLFRYYSPNSDWSARTDYYEDFRLPAVDTGRTGSDVYEILTTKANAVVDNLNSSSSTNVLSAKQGKVLGDALGKLVNTRYLLTGNTTQTITLGNQYCSYLVTTFRNMWFVQTQTNSDTPTVQQVLPDPRSGFTCVAQANNKIKLGNTESGDYAFTITRLCV